MRFSLVRNVKFGQQIKELRIHLCQTSAESQGARWAATRDYAIIFPKLIMFTFWILVNLCKSTMWPSKERIRLFLFWCGNAAVCNQGYGLVLVSWLSNFSIKSEFTDIFHSFFRTRQGKVCPTHECFIRRHIEIGWEHEIEKIDQESKNDMSVKRKFAFIISVGIKCS